MVRTPATGVAGSRRAAPAEPPLLELRASSKRGGPKALGPSELVIGWASLVVPLWFFDGDIYATMAPAGSKPDVLILTLATAAAAAALTAVVGIGSAVTARIRRHDGHH
ncbi:MAG: hypothetical protein AAGC46_05620 [Solirubrobacteraceae bacterium]|nr:hypothetical protein [Patulibacter sp.]